MRLQFYTKANRPYATEITSSWVKLFLDEKDDKKVLERNKNTFISAKCKIADRDVYTNTNSQSFMEEEQDIEKLVKSFNEVILVCDFEFFKRVVKTTPGYQIDVKLERGENGTLIHYAGIGEEQCALLVSCAK